MDVIDAIGLLKDYRLYDDAQNECRRKKIGENIINLMQKTTFYWQFYAYKSLNSFFLTIK